MGSSSFSHDFYAERAAERDRTGTAAFHYHDAIERGEATKQVHAQMNPKGVTVRESRDSEAHPESNAIVVMFDVTGSMRKVPMVLQTKLPQLMGSLNRKAYIPHPQILFGAIGDATSDGGPLQVGQFESGNEMENDLGNFGLGTRKPGPG